MSSTAPAAAAAGHQPKLPSDASPAMHAAQTSISASPQHRAAPTLGQTATAAATTRDQQLERAPLSPAAVTFGFGGGSSDVPRARAGSAASLSIDPDDMIMSGWMHKLGKFNRSWRRRMFVLHADRSLTYASSLDSDDQRVIDLRTALSVGPSTSKLAKAYSLDIVTQARKYTVAPESAADRDRWFTAIQQSIRESSQRPRQSVRRHGFLEKRGHGKMRKSWKTRYVALVQGKLAYFEEVEAFGSLEQFAAADERIYEKSLKKYARRLVPLHKASVAFLERPSETSRENCFVVETQAGQRYVFQCDSESESRAWIADIRSEIEASSVPRSEARDKPSELMSPVAGGGQQVKGAGGHNFSHARGAEPLAHGASGHARGRERVADRDQYRRRSRSTNEHPAGGAPSGAGGGAVVHVVEARTSRHHHAHEHGGLPRARSVDPMKRIKRKSGPITSPRRAAALAAALS